MTSYYQVFGIQFLTSITIYSILSYLFVFPYLKTKHRHTALTILIFPHLVRHLGMTLLTPGVVVGENLNQSFATSTAIGDYITVTLAILAIIALQKNWKAKLQIVWIFNIIGLSDFMLAMIKGIKYKVISDLGPQWYVIAFGVPILVVTHILIFILLTKK